MEKLLARRMEGSTGFPGFFHRTRVVTIYRLGSAAFSNQRPSSYRRPLVWSPKLTMFYNLVKQNPAFFTIDPYYGKLSSFLIKFTILNTTLVDIPCFNTALVVTVDPYYGRLS